MIRLFSIVMFALLGFGSASAQTAPSLKWYTGEIRNLYPMEDGEWVLIFKVSDPECPSTLGNKYHYVTVGEGGVTEEGSRKMYSAALAAALANKSVRVNYDAALARCTINRLIVNF